VRKLRSGGHIRGRSDRGARVVPSVARIARVLDSEYPDTNLGNKSNPLNELAFIILSGQTDAKLTQEAYRRFKRRFPRWSDVLNASASEITDAIRVAGLGRQKARYIKRTVLRLQQDFGATTLSPLKRMSTTSAERYLCSLPGVGVKSARCVLLYSLKRRVFPADIHCLRIMTRLGWVRWSGQRAECLADAAQQRVEPSIRRSLHVRLVQHGRAVCRSRPLCSECILKRSCPSAGQVRSRLGGKR
jgi:endonuclease III